MLILIANCLGKIIQFPLAEDRSEIRVGSLPDNDLCLPYKGVSRNHFSLTQQKSGWVLKDLGSTNGTRLNGKKVNESEIHPGDLIHAGIVELSLVEADQNKIVRIPERTPTSSHAGTDKMDDIARHVADNIFVSEKLVFPEGMIPGTSPKMREIYQRIFSLVDSDVNILLQGETGTGKEMFAQMLHLSGKRSKGPFIAINCAALPSELIEAELFGIGEKIATDVGPRTGKIELADEGTLFLDELSAFPIGLQSKILRAIEEKKVTPVGKHVPVQVDFRLISATNEDPQELIRTGRLREDLYHRIATVELVVPPLRERREDLTLLIIGLLQQICKREKKTIAGISNRLFDSLVSYSYPGNIRELINLLSSMVALAHPGEMLDLHLAPNRLTQTEKHDPSRQPEIDFFHGQVDLRTKLDETSKDWVLRALHLHDWNISAAARSLKITRFGLQKMMKRLGIPDNK
ncbi:sigma 54-interacting transcriptional regulator [bacterium]|nr:sigma 54-interacting transcriptional regulator [bacterium]MCI0603334.1 sigma 54-interacting transcriptional regulator [bacterium]